MAEQVAPGMLPASGRLSENPHKMNKTLPTIAALVAALSTQANSLVIDNFSGGPDLVTLVSVAPPEINVGSFAAGGALGGTRKVAVWSVSQGIFAAGVAFDAGGYASFTGEGKGALVWSGAGAIADGNNNKQIDVNEFGFGLNLNLVSELCENPSIDLHAFADLPNAVVEIFIASGAGDYNRYDVALTTVGGTGADYSVDLLSPTLSVGTLDVTSVKAFALFVDGTGFDNLDVQVSRLALSCPDGGWTLGSLGGALLGLGLARRTFRA